MDNGGIVKKFLRKIFYLDSTGKGAFWSLILLVLGTYLLGTLFIFSNGFYAAAVFIAAVFRFGIADIRVWDYPWQILLLLLFAGVIIHFFFQQYRLWKGVRRDRCNNIFWKYFALMLLLWAGVIFCLVYCIKLVVENYYHDGCSLEYLKDGAHSLPYWMTAAVILIFAGIAASGKVYSLIGNYPFRHNFTLPVWSVIVLAAIVYIGSIASSLVVRKLVDAEKAALARQFHRPLTVEALQKYCSDAGRTDEKFWQKIASFKQKFFECKEIGFCFAEFSPEQLEAWRKKFHSSREFDEIDRMTANPLPLPGRKIEKYRVANISLTDFSTVRTMARLQAWRIRFALEKGDRQEVMSALKRLDNLSDYLSAQPLLISALVKNAIDAVKVEALELVLAAQILNKDDLHYLKQRSRYIQTNLNSMASVSLWSEIICGIDFIEAFVNARSLPDGKKCTPFKKFRFLLPQGWLIFESNRLNYLRFFRNTVKFHDVQYVRDISVFNFFGMMIIPAYHAAEKRMLQNRLKQKAIGFFIDQELYRLDHGRFPAGLPLPVDPFRGKPLKYVRGEVTLKKEIFQNAGKEITVSARQLTSATQGTYNVTVTIPDQISPGVVTAR